MYVKKTLLERDKVYFSNLYDSKKNIFLLLIETLVIFILKIINLQLWIEKYH